MLLVPGAAAGCILRVEHHAAVDLTGDAQQELLHALEAVGLPTHAEAAAALSLSGGGVRLPGVPLRDEEGEQRRALRTAAAAMEYEQQGALQVRVLASKRRVTHSHSTGWGRGSHSTCMPKTRKLKKPDEYRLARATISITGECTWQISSRYVKMVGAQHRMHTIT